MKEKKNEINRDGAQIEELIDIPVLKFQWEEWIWITVKNTTTTRSLTQMSLSLLRLTALLLRPNICWFAFVLLGFRSSTFFISSLSILKINVPFNLRSKWFLLNQYFKHYFCSLVYKLFFILIFNIMFAGFVSLTLKLFFSSKNWWSR